MNNLAAKEKWVVVRGSAKRLAIRKLHGPVGDENGNAKTQETPKFRNLPAFASVHDVPACDRGVFSAQNCSPH
ncbi:MAG: hypothetical protein R3C53_08585 [Pirellulaceae bacterium]